MIRAIICDDEEKARKLLRRLLDTCNMDVEVIAEASNLPDAVIAVNEHQPDVLFLDIEMPKYTGLQVLDFYPSSALPCALVFVTAYNEFAMQAFRLAALDYILKPPTREILEEVLNRVSDGTTAQQREKVETLKAHYAAPFSRIALPNSQGFEFVGVDDILYMEADGMYTHLFMTDGTKQLVSKPLVDFEKLLQDHDMFFKVHRKYLVHLQHMQKFTRGTYEIMMNNGTSLPLSRHRKQDFEDVIRALIPGRN